jgi:hypothetical protein
MNDEAAGRGTAQPHRPAGRATPPPFTIPDHELIRPIGRGSYGEVWLARNVSGQYRAVKIVSRASFDHERPYAREFDGIQRSEPHSRTHEGLVDILHIGRNDEAGYFFYIMELADDASAEGGGRSANAGEPEVEKGKRRKGEGERLPADQSPLPPFPSAPLRPFSVGTYAPKTLHGELKRRGRFTTAEAVQIGLQIASALEHLHRHGLAHRDVKPANIIFVEGAPKLADIGLVAGAETTRSFVGTEGFVPPEGAGTPRADLYSLGKVLYEMVTGQARCDYPALPDNFRELPDRNELVELNEVIAQACEGDLKKRYRSAATMHADLVRLARGNSLRRRKTWRRRMLAGGVIGLVASVVFLAALAWKHRDHLLGATRDQPRTAPASANRTITRDSDGDGLSDEYERGFGRYELIAGEMKWSEAKADAAKRGGHLATITSQEEWEAILHVLASQGQSFQDKSVAIGGTDAEEEGVWKWITGEPWSFNRWHQNGVEPSNTLGNEHALGITDYPGNPWNDIGEHAQQTHYLLEFGFYTNPLHPDTDGDGWSDAAELAAGTLPVDAASLPSGPPGFRDDFDGEALEPSRWVLQRAFGNSSVSVGAGRVRLTNAGRFIAARPFTAAAMKGRFRFAGSTNDSLSIYLGSDAQHLEGRGATPNGLLVRFAPPREP